jgi:hypothetical protein
LDVVTAAIIKKALEGSGLNVWFFFFPPSI